MYKYINQHVVYAKHTMWYANYISVKLEKRKAKDILV